MTRNTIALIGMIGFLLLGGGATAQQFEAVYSLEGVSSSDAEAAMDDLFSDPAMKGAKVSVYAADFGVREGSHKSKGADPLEPS